MIRGRALQAVAQGGGLTGLFPGLDLTVQQTEEALLEGLTAGVTLAEADAGFRWDAFSWGLLAGTWGSVTGVIAAGWLRRRP